MNLYIPFSYLFNSRIRTKHERISWFIIFPLFLLITVYLFNGDAIGFFAGFVMTMSLYEVGYLDNDFRTVRKEVNPTIRFTEQRKWIARNFFSLVVTRFCVAFLCLIYIFQTENSTHKLLTSIFIAILIVSFYFHNTLRSRWNIVTYFFVVMSRYCLPVVIAVNSDYYVWLIPFIILVFPALRTVEHCCKVKYDFPGLRKFVKNPDIFRVKWYSTLLLILVFWLGFSDNADSLKLIFLCVYFLLYRIATLFASKSKGILRNKHDSYKWDNDE